MSADRQTEHHAASVYDMTVGDLCDLLNGADSDATVGEYLPPVSPAARLTLQDRKNLLALAHTVGVLVQFDRGRMSGHGWEEMVAAYDAYWQERAHPFDDSEILGA
jgi:hypothetical protein